MFIECFSFQMNTSSRVCVQIESQWLTLFGSIHNHTNKHSHSVNYSHQFPREKSLDKFSNFFIDAHNKQIRVVAHK
jgi:hypothetical protein